jgi:putative ABC transport system substrate-binding protein
MNRREFIGAALGSICVPAATIAQVGRARRRIGWLDFGSSLANLGLFEQSMAGRGWIKGETFGVDYRSSEGSVERLATATAELIRLPVDVIVAPGVAEALAAKNATRTVPVVIAGIDDPVARGLVVSLARPGRNVTGVARAHRELVGRLLSFVREVVPGTSRMAVLVDSADPDHRGILGDLHATARSTHASLNAVEVEQYMDVEPAVARIKRQGSKVLVVPPSSMFVPRWIADLALTNGLALASTSPAYAYEGGLLACADDWAIVYDRAAAVVDRILRGAKPADIAIESPTKFRLIVNARTARTLKITLPQPLLSRADAVIE